MRFSIVKRYIFREVLQSFVSVLLVLTMIWLSVRFVRYLADAAAGKVSAGLILEVLALNIASRLEILLPIALYLAILLGLGRMYKDNEIVAMAASGIGTKHIGSIAFWLGAGFAVFGMLLSLYLTPMIKILQTELLREAKDQTEISAVFPGRFQEFEGGYNVLYVEDISSDRQLLSNIFISTTKPDDAVIVSRLAYQTVDGKEGDRYVVLEDGHRYAGNPGDADYVVTNFGRHGVLVEQSERGQSALRPETYPTFGLLAAAEPELRAELHRRLSMPVLTVVLALMAVPLARTSPRQGRYAKLLTAFLICFAYNNLLGVGVSLVRSGDAPAVLAVWTVHLCFALLLGVLFFEPAGGGSRGLLRLLRYRA